MATITILNSAILATIFHCLILKASCLNTTSSSSSTIPNTSIGSDFTTHRNFKLLPTLDQCGYRFSSNIRPVSNRLNRVRRVTHGVPTHPGNMPWMVQIFFVNVATQEQSLACGGTLINENTVLTSADCAAASSPGWAKTDVVLGAYYLNQGSANNYTKKRVNYSIKGFNYSAEIFLVEIESIKIHENYISKISKNDIALIKLKQNISSLVITKIPLNNEYESGSSNIDLNTIEIIRPICLPRSRSILQGLVGQNFEIAGWGDVNAYDDDTITPMKATQLNKISLILQPLDYCQDFFGNYYGPLDDTVLCTLGAPGEDTCSADGGSPLMKAIDTHELNGRQQVFQFGFVSNFIDCGRQGAPTLFTNVVEFMPWILDNLGS